MLALLQPFDVAGLNLLLDRPSDVLYGLLLLVMRVLQPGWVLKLLHPRILPGERGVLHLPALGISLEFELLPGGLLRKL